VFTAAATSLLIFIYLNKMLRHLDPSRVIPQRVRRTLDALAEGLLVLDQNDRILLANRAFAENLGKTADELSGFRAALSVERTTAQSTSLGARG
jgi:PAS domain-containing protein